MFNSLANPTVSTFKVLLTSHICTTFTVFILIQTTIIFHLSCCNNLPFGFRAFVLAQLQSILFSSKSTYFKIKTDDATWWLPLSFREESCHVTASMALLSLCLHPLLSVLSSLSFIKFESNWTSAHLKVFGILGFSIDLGHGCYGWHGWDIWHNYKLYPFVSF